MQLLLIRHGSTLDNEQQRYSGQSDEPLSLTIVQLRDRVVRALEFWYAGHAEDTVVWATHGGVIRVLLCYLLNTDLNSWGQFKRENASITEVRLGQNAGGSIGLIEDPHTPLLNM